MREFLTAISVLTILPLKKNVAATEYDLARSTLYFPLVGLLLGFVLMAVTQALLSILPPGPLAALVLLLLIVITGGLHLDGLADLCDGLGVGGNREQILSVMKDSRIGAFGVMGLVIVLILKYTLFYEIIARGSLNAFLVMGILSRWGMVLAAFRGRYARVDGTGKPFIGKVSWKRAMGATGIAIGVSWVILQTPGLIAAFVVFLFVLLFNRQLEFRIGGLTGDGLGSLNELAEILVLLSIVASPSFLEIH